MNTLVVIRSSPKAVDGYHDTFVIVGSDKAVSIWPGSSVPWERDAHLGAHLLPIGRYKAEKRSPVGGQPAWSIKSEKGGAPIDDRFALHVGESIPAVGCLTVSPRDYHGFTRALGGPNATFDIVVRSK